MDAISYSHSVKQEKRIKKIIADPDSNSGIVTVPKVIGAGESVTVPAGRVAVLPNIQVDGEIVVKGEVFVPAGSSVDFSTGIKVNGEKLTMSIPTAYHIYNGSVEATNTEITNGFSTTLYTGNGTTQNVITDVDMATQWGDDASETFGGLVWLKSRSVANDNFIFDTIRGVGKSIKTNTSAIEVTTDYGIGAWRNNGFLLGGSVNMNTNLATYASWNFQTTHRTSGVTNHGKPYTCHYNPYTGFTIVKYQGSGTAGHEIPHHLSRKLDFDSIKNLNSTDIWINTSSFGDKNYYLSYGANGWISYTDVNLRNDTHRILGDSVTSLNGSGSTYIMYGWANSYFDESNKLIGNYEIGAYQGTGAHGNKIKTRNKPAWVMVKRLDTTGNWAVLDNMRGNSNNTLYPNLSNAEGIAAGYGMDLLSDGFTIDNGAGVANADWNAAGGQYLYIVVYDNDSGSGKTKYPKATDTTNLSINALVPYANGIDVNGSKVSIEYKNETITGLTLAQGKNYVYSKNDGTYGVSSIAPKYNDFSSIGDVFDTNKYKWYSVTALPDGGANQSSSDLIPVMSANINHGFIVSANTTLSNYPAYLSFNDNSSNGWVANSITTGWLNIELPQSKVVNKYSLVNYSAYPARMPKNWTLQASNTGIFSGEQVILDTRENIAWSDLVKQYFTFSNANAYKHYRIVVAANGGDSTYLSIGEMELIEAKLQSAEITPRTYLDCVVHADHNGQVSYVEELPKTTYFDRIETLDNRVVMYLEDYGISQIQTNKRYILNNPFGNENCMDCDVKIELMIDNKWFGANWDGSSGSVAAAYGATVFSQPEGIVIQTGVTAIDVQSSLSGSGSGTAVATTTAPARVIVTYNGKTRRVKNG